ncbi:MAG: NADH-quinone oxidoreductase subunit NuoE [Bacteroidales bacterium]|nr:NADH-quinone oxidoreductase subunit NuoE [Bacteroidales bacterium]MBN2755775.1 NADH-quinone oxidoreductase subunit NuoE [Bacteroidales bacterium]
MKTEEILSKYKNTGRDNLIPVLQEIQENEGWLSEKIISDVGKCLNIPAGKVYGVATFYNQFRFQPKGKYHIQICRGTACHVLGSSSVLQELEKSLKIKADETSRDGLFSIEVVACIGACGLAPVICINGEFHAKVTVDSLKKIISDLKTQNLN